MGRPATRTETKGLREFLNSSRGRSFTTVIVVILVGVCGYLIWRQLGPGDAGKISRDRTYIDAQTLKPFAYELQLGDMIPVNAPSGGKTGYPAELCYWTKDGQIKEEPTAVLLNSRIGKPGPTFCPDCGRLVVGHNPEPKPGMKPPPTKEEYYATHGGSP